MKVQLNTVDVKTNATTTITKPVAAYETEILAAVHGDGNVIDRGPVGELEVESIDAEITRLCRLYGRARLEELYGKLLKGLSQAIKDAQLKKGK